MKTAAFVGSCLGSLVALAELLGGASNADAIAHGANVGTRAALDVLGLSDSRACASCGHAIVLHEVAGRCTLDDCECGGLGVPTWNYSGEVLS